MRLMYVLPAEAFGGAERQGVLHIRKLGDYDIDLTPVVGPGVPVQQALHDYGFRDYHYCADFPRATHSNMGLSGNIRFGLDYARAFMRSSEKLAKIGRESQIDMILAGRSFGWAVAARAARSLGVPYVVRAGSRAIKPGQLLAIRSMRMRFGRPAALLSNCVAVEKNLIQAFDCPGYIVPNGVDTLRFDPSRVEACYRQGLTGPVVGLAARPAPEKGMEVFAKTVERTCARIPGTTFLVAGEFGWRSHYQEQALQLGLGDKIRFLGHVDSMPEFFASCDVVVLTSPHQSIEGSPNAILEAMSMARAVVASKVGGLPEIIRNGVEGFLVDPEAPEQFAARIADLLERPIYASLVGKAGRARILERHSEGVAMQALVTALHRVENTFAQSPKPRHVAESLRA